MLSKVIRFLISPLFLLSIILVIGFLVRLYRVDNPIADWHSWRQADTAAVSRYFYQNGFNPLIPKYDDMSGVAENPIPNPNRYRFVEFPIYNTIVYFFYLLNGGVDEKIARLVSIFFSLGSVVFVYLITKKYLSYLTSLIAAFLMAVLPFNIYFSRVILPEPSLVFFSLGMFYFTDRWIREKGNKLFILSALFAICAFLLKPVAVFYLLPLGIVYYQVEKKIFPNKAKYFVWILIVFLPYILWRMWMNQFPEGIPASGWLLDGNHLRLRPAFFRWIVGDRFGREILGVAGTFLFLLGVLLKPTFKSGLLLQVWVVSIVLYLIIFATGNVQHDYYQYLIVPPLVIFVARGFVELLKGINVFVPRIITIPLAFLLLGLTIYLPWVEVKGLYQINNPAIVEAGEKANEILPKDAKVIAPYQGDTSFLYQIKRPGFPIVFSSVEEMKKTYGLTSYVSTTQDTKTKWLMRKYLVLEENPKFVIIDLTKVNSQFYQNANSLDDVMEP